MHLTRPDSVALSATAQPLAAPLRSSRRAFLKATAAAALAMPTQIPQSVLGGNGTTPPSERIRLGIIGCGNMGQTSLTSIS